MRRLLVVFCISILLAYTLYTRPALADPVTLAAVGLVSLLAGFFAGTVYQQWADQVSKAPETPSVELEAYIADVSRTYYNAFQNHERMLLSMKQFINYTYAYYSTWARNLVAEAWSENNGTVNPDTIPDILDPIVTDLAHFLGNLTLNYVTVLQNIESLSWKLFDLARDQGLSTDNITMLWLAVWGPYEGEYFLTSGSPSNPIEVYSSGNVLFQMFDDYNYSCLLYTSPSPRD